MSSDVGAALTADACNENVKCLNGGNCVTGGSSSFHYCQCPEYYSGSRCERYCPLHCKNSGQCQRITSAVTPSAYMHDTDTNHYFCNCKGFFVGDMCETSYVVCSNGAKCYNQGTCVPHKTQSATWWFLAAFQTTCACPVGYSGHFCEILDNVTVANNKADANKSIKIGVCLGVTFFVIVVFVFVAQRMRRRGRVKQSKLIQIEMEARETQSLSKDVSICNKRDCRNVI
jgi:hypothetical protein